MTAAEIAGIWIGLIYARPDRPPMRQRDSLVTLAVGVKPRDSDHPDLRTIALDALDAVCGAGRRTIQRALRWAVKAGLLKCKQRGHRIADGITVPTTWQLLIP